MVSVHWILTRISRAQIQLLVFRFSLPSSFFTAHYPEMETVVFNCPEAGLALKKETPDTNNNLRR